jgi:uncharacterized protein (DUF697 family)
VKIPTALLFEVRRLVEAMQAESEPERAGPIVVSGMLCEQLARELGAGAVPGAVVVGDQGSRDRGAEVRVHVMAGEPSRADESLVQAADREGIPVVLVQLWPQERWTPPYVLTPFVVECRAGEGFPVQEIARKITDAAEHWTELARSVPVLQEVVSTKLVNSSVVRSALAGALGRPGRGTRSLLALEQVRLVARLQSLQGGSAAQEPPVAAGAALAALALSFALRGAARGVREVVPPPLAHAAIAAGATWALAAAARRFNLSTT